MNTKKYITLDQALEVLDRQSCYWAAEYMKLIPAADVRPVVHGKWTEYHTKCNLGYGKIYYQHEECSCQIFEAPYNYCPNCGARMKES